MSSFIKMKIVNPPEQAFINSRAPLRFNSWPKELSELKNAVKFTITVYYCGRYRLKPTKGKGT